MIRYVKSPGVPLAEKRNLNISVIYTITSWLKTWITTLVLWGWLPFLIVEWINKRGNRKEVRDGD